MSVENENKIIGNLSEKVVKEFGLSLKIGQPILLGESNLKHMESEHPEDFKKYGDKIEEIIKTPDFIAKHPKKKDSAIEYIKIFKNEEDEHVLVAVRATGAGKLFARTLFVMDPEKVERYKSKNALKPYK